MNIEMIKFKSSKDGTIQKSLFAPASGSVPRPLLVALHTWSADCSQNSSGYFDFAKKANWHCVFPDFRGPNNTPEALGSELVVQDIKDLLIYIKQNVQVDEDRIYLMGGSGGGHAALLLAGRMPEVWTAVSAWCPITDVGLWEIQCRNHPDFKIYSEHIIKACGTDAESAWKRSPLCYLSAAKNLKISINCGIHDGHIGSVPVSHSINAFNLLASASEQIPEAIINEIVRTEKVPESCLFTGIDELFGSTRIWLSRISGNCRLVIFEGGHDLLYPCGLQWLAAQRKVMAPVWNICSKINTVELSGIGS